MRWDQPGILIAWSQGSATRSLATGRRSAHTELLINTDSNMETTAPAKTSKGVVQLSGLGQVKKEEKQKKTREGSLEEDLEEEVR